MNIKYVNIVLDKEMFMDKMRDICVPKVKLPREPEVNLISYGILTVMIVLYMIRCLLL